MHFHSLKRAALAACVTAVAAISPASAATVPAELRVEAAGGQDLTHGWTYLSDTTTLSTDRGEQCNGSGASRTFEGATALGILEHARRHNDRLDPIRISDQFDFGLLVCGIGAFTSSDTQFWTYKVNHVAPEVAAEQYPLKAGDDVLWTLQDIEANTNTGNELELVAPGTVEPGEPFEVTVNEYDFGGKKTPAAGAHVAGAAEAVTDDQGKATVALAGGDPSEILRAFRASDIPSAPVRICVGRCERIAKQRIFGTRARDVISARGKFAEYVSASGGNDRIDVRGDSFSDRVRCGRGRDRVLADRRDRVARDCERVTRT
jgi:hypothetical protein